MPGKKNKQKQTWAFACSSVLLSRVFAEAPWAGMQLSRDYSLRLWGNLQLCPRACRISLCRLCDSGLSDSQLTAFLFLCLFSSSQIFSPLFKYSSFNQAENGLCIQLSYHRLNKGNALNRGGLGVTCTSVNC